MSIMLRPPILSGTIPAFTAGEIKVPFSMNRSVSSNEVYGFALKIRTAQGQLIKTITLDLTDRKEEKEKYISDGIVPFSIESLEINLRDYSYGENATEEQRKFIELFNEDENGLLLSAYYKFQLAYCSLDQNNKLLIGYYSTAAVGKYSSEPKISIVGLERYPNKNESQYSYTGVYDQSNDYLRENKDDFLEEFFDNEDNYELISTIRLTKVPVISSDKRYIDLGNKKLCYWTKMTQIAGTSEEDNVVKEEIFLAQTQERDSSEKLYSSKIIILTDLGEVYYQSAEQLHNTLNDNDSKIAKETFSVIKELPQNEIFYLFFKVTTRNGLETSSKSYRIVNKAKIDNEFQGNVKARLNSENGYIDIDLIASNNYDAETGHFVISRISSKEPNIWRELYRFDLNREIPSRHIWKDFTIEQGVTYTYAIQQYSISEEDGEPLVYTKRIKSNSVLADFEYTYLFDGDRQLKIKYNPQVSSFKTDILETKVDAIGGKYPIFYRNGIVNYKEFPISGLISCLSDDESIFYSGLYNIIKKIRTKTAEDDMQDERVLMTDLVAENYTNEREFKLAVLDWLNNGKPKLFKSPTEGNYIVRLTNTSLAPTDSLGRMLHTFTTQAYEIAENNYDNLLKFNIINFDIMDRKQKNYSTYELKDMAKNYQPVIIKFTNVDSSLRHKITIIDNRNVIDKIVRDDIEIIKEDEDLPEVEVRLDANSFLKFYCKTNLKPDIPLNFTIKVDTIRDDDFKFDIENGQLDIKISGQQTGVANSIFTCTYTIDQDINYYIVPLGENVQSFKITDVLPETIIEADGKEYMVGPTGVYNHEGAVTDLIFRSPRRDLTGNIYLEYWDSFYSYIDLIADTQLVECPRRQFYGQNKSINIVDDIEDVRTSLVGVYNLYFHKKNKKNIKNYFDNLDAYKNSSYKDFLKMLNDKSIQLDAKFLYYSDLKRDGLGYPYYYYYDENDKQYYAVAQHRVYDKDSCTYTYPDTKFLYYYYNKETGIVELNTKKSASPFNFAINSKTDIIDLDLLQTEDYNFDFDDLNINTIQLNFGLNLEISYLTREISYKIEATDNILINSRKNYLKQLSNFQKALNSGQDLYGLADLITKAYNLYLTNLMKRLKSECNSKHIKLGQVKESKKLI